MEKDGIEELVEQAFNLMQEAEENENSREWESAIYKYQQAADILAKCGIKREKLDEIYERIAQLNKISESQKQNKTLEPKEDPQKYQNAAFSLIDEAKDFENQMKYEASLEKYLMAVELLFRAGWEESQLLGFRSEIKRVKQKIKQAQQPLQTFPEKQTEINPSITKPSQMFFSQQADLNELENNIKQISQINQNSGEIKPQLDPDFDPMNPFGNKIEEKTPTIQKSKSPSGDVSLLDKSMGKVRSAKIFEEQKKYHEDVQNRAFLVLDQAKKLEAEKNYSDSIEKYLEAVEILNEIGWVNETNEIYEVIGAIGAKIEDAQDKEVKAIQISEVAKDSALSIKSDSGEKIISSTIFSLKEFELKRIKEEKLRDEAFSHINSAVKKIEFKEYDKAIADYNRAIVILNSIGWQKYTENIEIEIKNVMDLKIKFDNKLDKHVSLLKPISQIEDEEIRDAYLRESESRTQKFKQFEQNKVKEKELQEQAFIFIGQGQELLSESLYDKAIEKYQQAVHILIGIGWQDQIKHLNEIIGKIHEEKIHSELIKQQKQLIRIRRQSEEQNFRKQIAEKASKEKEIAKSDKITQIEDFKKQKKSKEKLQEQALEIIDEANKIAKSNTPDYNKAISLYQKAYKLLNKAGWMAELGYINKMVESLNAEKVRWEQEQLKIEELKNKTSEDQVAFQDTLKQRMAQFDAVKEEQRQALKIFQNNREKENEIEKEAFKFMNNASQCIKETNFEEAIESYQKAIKKFKEINWVDQIAQIEKEIPLIQVMQEKKQREIDALEKQMALKQEAEIAAKMKEKLKKQKELDDLNEISSMISNITKKKKEEEIEEQIIKKEIQKPSKSIDEQIPHEGKFGSLRKGVMAVIEEKRRDIFKEEEKEEKDLNDFKKMIKKASNEANKKNLYKKKKK